MAPKITLVVITTFFPITVGLLDGYKSVDRDSIRPDASHGSLKAADLLACEVSRRFAAVFCGIEDILFLCGGGRSHLGMAGRI